MRIFFIILAVFCFYGFLFTLSVWLGFVGIFLGVAFSNVLKQQITKLLPPASKLEIKSNLPPSEAELPEIQGPISNNGVPEPHYDGELQLEKHPSGIEKGRGFFNKVGSFVVTLIVFLVVKYVVTFSFTEAQVTASKYTSWDRSFKQSFIKSCKDASRIMIEKEFTDGEISVAENQDLIEGYSDSYCVCITNITEEKHIVATKYNRHSRNLAQVNAESEKDISMFLNTSEGKLAVESCRALAIEKVKTPRASH